MRPVGGCGRYRKKAHSHVGADALLGTHRASRLPDPSHLSGEAAGKEITLYSVWLELRYGISACLILTISLITAIFYFHPATSNVISFFRTVPVLPEGYGRVEEVYVGVREQVKAGQPLFKLDTSKQEASAETARRKDCRDRCRARVGQDAARRRQRPGRRGAKRLSAGRRRACHQAGTVGEKRLDSCAARYREAQGRRPGQGSRRASGTCQPAIVRGADLVRSPDFA